VSGGIGACPDAARRDSLGEGAVQASPFAGQEILIGRLLHEGMPKGVAV
jgi:hypothetical protein